MNYLLTSVILSSALLVTACNGETAHSSNEDAVKITLAPETIRSIGGVTEFSRDQFITVHAAPGEGDLNDEDVAYLTDELEVSYGRDGGLRSWKRSQTPADPNRPGFPDVEAVIRMGEEHRHELTNSTRTTPAIEKEIVHCTHPEWFYAKPDQTHAPFGPTSYEGAAEFTAQFLKHFWDDESRPKYLEVFNEPFVHTKQVSATIEGYCEQHVAVARRIKELTPEVLVGGYTAAWAEMEHDNFGHWDRWQKKFMDLAGADMDFFSTHIYDGVNVTGDPVNRTGSNSEAIIDMIDQYSAILWGVAKPQVISEYGLIPGNNMGLVEYSPKRSGKMIRSTNAQLMTFMDHPDRLIKTVPFFIGKASWTYTEGHEPGHANPFLLWRKQADGTYVTTDLVLFYEFWKGIEGQWRDSTTSDPDVRVHLLADGNRLNVLLINIEEAAREIQLNGLARLAADQVTLRRLQIHKAEPTLTESELNEIPQSLTLQAGESTLLQIELKEELKAKQISAETRVYATSYLKPIEADQANEFEFIDTPTGEGRAILRLSFGREKGKSLDPEVTFNGHTLEVPTDWAGDDQSGRKTFLGMLEVPVPMQLIKSQNTATVTFPDNGGKVASVILQVNRLSPLGRAALAAPRIPSH